MYLTSKFMTFSRLGWYFSLKVAVVSQLLVSRNCLFSRNEVPAVGGRGVEGLKEKKEKKKLCKIIAAERCERRTSSICCEETKHKY